MAVGGMPQAVERYIETNNLEKTDEVKREILALYSDDLKKIDPSGRLSDIYLSVPAQLSQKKKRFVISKATGKRKTLKDEERLFDLIDSGLVLPCYNVAAPSLTLSAERKADDYKLYLSDIGLYVSLVFRSDADIYRKLLSDKLPANLGYLYENAVAQALASSGRKLYFHSWRKADSTHSYEIDFLLSSSFKIIPLEVKSSSVRNHESITAFCEKYSSIVGRRIIFSQKDREKDGPIELLPIYMVPFFLEEIS